MPSTSPTTRARFSAAIRSLTTAAYSSTYSWPDSRISSYMISSVTERRTWRSSAIPSYREKSSGRPMMIPTRWMLGSLRPIGCTFSVPTMATGITGTRLSRAILATPTLPRYSRASGERVPSG